MDDEATTEQLGASSSDKTLRHGLADGRSRAATVDLAQDSTGTGREQRRLHQTRRPVNQHVRVCVKRCALTTRHIAKRCGDNCQARALGRDLSSRDDAALAGLQPGSQGKSLRKRRKRSHGLISPILYGFTDHDARSKPRVGGGRWRRDAPKPRRLPQQHKTRFHSEPVPLTHAEGGVAGKAASVPRAARGAACGRRRHVGQHLDVRGAHKM